MIKRELEEYLSMGGFPEVLKISEDFIFFIFSDIVYKDVVERLRIKRIELFKAFAVNVMRYFSNEVSLSRISRTLKVSNNTVEEWFRGLVDAYAVLTSERYTERPREAMTSSRKVYVVVPGFASAIAMADAKGRIMENVVALHIARSGRRLFYLKGDEYEVDFLVEDIGIQVTYASGRDEVPRREVEGLSKAKVKRRIAVTWDY